MLFSKPKPRSILCPQCEEPLDAHADGACPKRKLSRRFFLGAIGTAFAAAAVAQVLPNVVVEEAPAGSLVSLAAPVVHRFGTLHFHGEDIPQWELQEIANRRRATVSNSSGTGMRFAEPAAFKAAGRGR